MNKIKIEKRNDTPSVIPLIYDVTLSLYLTGMIIQGRNVFDLFPIVLMYLGITHRLDEKKENQK